MICFRDYHLVDTVEIFETYMNNVDKLIEERREFNPNYKLIKELWEQKNLHGVVMEDNNHNIKGVFCFITCASIYNLKEIEAAEVIWFVHPDVKNKTYYISSMLEIIREKAKVLGATSFKFALNRNLNRIYPLLESLGYTPSQQIYVQEI